MAHNAVFCHSRCKRATRHRDHGSKVHNVIMLYEVRRKTSGSLQEQVLNLRR